MDPPERVREVLADHKRAGADFEVAWARALKAIPTRTIELRAWYAALEWARPAFEAAFDRNEA